MKKRKQLSIWGMGDGRYFFVPDPPDNNNYIYTSSEDAVREAKLYLTRIGNSEAEIVIYDA